MTSATTRWGMYLRVPMTKVLSSKIIPRFGTSSERLERLGFTAITLENDKKAVEAAVNEKSDLIFMNVVFRE